MRCVARSETTTTTMHPPSVRVAVADASAVFSVSETFTRGAGMALAALTAGQRRGFVDFFILAANAGLSQVVHVARFVEEDGEAGIVFGQRQPMHAYADAYAAPNDEPVAVQQYQHSMLHALSTVDEQDATMVQFVANLMDHAVHCSRDAWEHSAQDGEMPPKDSSFVVHQLQYTAHSALQAALPASVASSGTDKWDVRCRQVLNGVLHMLTRQMVHFDAPQEDATAAVSCAIQVAIVCSTAHHADTASEPCSDTDVDDDADAPSNDGGV